MPTIVKKCIPVFLCFLVSLSARSQSKIDAASIRPKMQWFADAKLGIFIHAGIYSVKEWMNHGVSSIKKCPMQIICSS